MSKAQERMADGDKTGVSPAFHSTKASEAYGHPYRYANALNPQLLRLSALSGWIVLDYFSAPPAEHIYQINLKI